ncbi:MAG: aspartate/glutamate racemase family protein [Chitinophagales bacterium]
MKTLGLIGGTGWVSTLEYYRLINQGVNAVLGGNNAAKLFLYSVNYHEFRAYNDNKQWPNAEGILCDAARKLESVGAECIVICANTLHRSAKAIQASVGIPVIHIAEVVAAAIKKQNLNTVALLGTKGTMEEDFFKDILAANGIKALIPDDADRNFIHYTIFEELGKEIFTVETKQRYLNIINQLVQKGAQGVILGCTEIPLLIKPEECPVPAFDTLELHVKAAVEFALSDMAANKSA